MIYKMRVAYYETDQMGVVHHSNYLRYFENARVALFENMRMSYKDIEDEFNVYMIVIESYVKYIKPAKFHMLLDIETTIIELTKRIIKIQYIIKNNNILIAKGYTKHTLIDRDTGELVVCNEELLNILKEEK